MGRQRCASSVRSEPNVIDEIACLSTAQPLEQFATQTVHVASCTHQRLFRRPQNEDHRSPQTGHYQESEAARAFGVSRSSIKRYAKLVEEGRPLAPKKRPGSKPKMDESATRLLEADVERRPAATLSERREFLEKVAGVGVSESTVSRMLRRLGWSRKKGRWVRASATSS
jgi:transposase